MFGDIASAFGGEPTRTVKSNLCTIRFIPLQRAKEPAMLQAKRRASSVTQENGGNLRGTASSEGWQAFQIRVVSEYGF